MNAVTLILVAVGLAMDAFAVSVTSGITIQRMRLRHALLIASCFGLFQGLMPLAGWLMGRAVHAWLHGLEPWAAFGLLSGVGLKME